MNNTPYEFDYEDYRPCEFEEWLAHFFGDEATSPDLSDCLSSNLDEASFFLRLFEDPITYLTPYTNEQIGAGLYTIIHENGDGGIYALSKQTLPWDPRRRAIHAMYNIFEKIFEPHCEPILSHLIHDRQTPQTRMNGVCYMWWDIIGLQGEYHGNPENDVIAIDVMERTLKLKNIACLEGALHGLGHYYWHNENRVKAIIDQFLVDNPDLPDELGKYALNARSGNVQ